MREHSIISSVLKSLTFDQYSELYYYIDAFGNKISPLDANFQIYTSLNKNNIRAVNAGNSVIQQSTIGTINSYISSTPDLLIQDCAKLLTLFQG